MFMGSGDYMIIDYTRSVNTGDKNTVEFIFPNVKGIMKAIVVKCSQKYFNFAMWFTDYDDNVIIDERAVRNSNVYFVPKLRVYNVSIKDHDKNMTEFYTLNDSISVKISGGKNMDALVILRCEE